MTGEDKNFATRWSKRKVAARQENEVDQGDKSANFPDQEYREADTNIDGTEETQLTDADFEDVDFDQLDKNSDYTRFIKANVPAAIQKKALRKLWASDSVFEVLDGMNDYDEDFTVDGLAGKVFKSAYKIGRGYLSDEDEDENAEITEETLEVVDRENNPDNSENTQSEGDPDGLLEYASVEPEKKS